jgi:hypothetical protein
VPRHLRIGQSEISPSSFPYARLQAAVTRRHFPRCRGSRFLPTNLPKAAKGLRDSSTPTSPGRSVEDKLSFSNQCPHTASCERRRAPVLGDPKIRDGAEAGGGFPVGLAGQGAVAARGLYLLPNCRLRVCVPREAEAARVANPLAILNLFQDAGNGLSFDARSVSGDRNARQGRHEWPACSGFVIPPISSAIDLSVTYLHLPSRFKPSVTSFDVKLQHSRNDGTFWGCRLLCE